MMCAVDVASILCSCFVLAFHLLRQIIGGGYPNNTFTAVIFSRDVTKFSNVDALNGKTVDVTGPVRLHNGRPEIILNDQGRIKAK